jgi:hypothetical protein
VAVYKEFFAQSPLLVLPLAALVFFLAVFLAVVARTMVRRAPAYARIAELPLREEDRDERN